MQQTSIETFIVNQVRFSGALRGGPGGNSGTGPGFFKGARNFGDSTRYIYTKIKNFKVKSSLFYRNIQNAQKETAKDNSVT